MIAFVINTECHECGCIVPHDCFSLYYTNPTKLLNEMWLGVQQCPCDLTTWLSISYTTTTQFPLRLLKHESLTNPDMFSIDSIIILQTCTTSL